MTDRERFLACMHFASLDRVPLWEWGPWHSTLRRWWREGLREGQHPAEFAECDRRAHCNVDLWMRPRFEQRVVCEDDSYRTEVTERGIVMKVPKDPDAETMPHHLEYPVKTAEDWEDLKKRWDPTDRGRLGEDWAQRLHQWRSDGSVVILQGPRQPSLFGFVRELMGPERAMRALYDAPGLVHDIMEFNTEFLVRLFSWVLDEAPVTTVFLWEDMAYREGSLISPRHFREFMIPRYQRITDVIRGKGIDIIMVDSDGDVSELIPLWLESGINGIYPLEVAAGMDVAQLQGEYGKDLVMTGGIDKRTLAESREAIEAELARTIPLAEHGGYIPHLDHAIPNDVPYDGFRYYWERKKQMLGVS